MADFRNRRRFSLRCLSKCVIPGSVRLKSNTRTPRGYYIIKRANRVLLNERLRTINNTLEMFEYQRDTCIDHFCRALDKEAMEKCKNFINRTREARHKKTLDHQKAKFERLYQKSMGGHSNQDQYICVAAKSQIY